MDWGKPEPWQAAIGDQVVAAVKAAIPYVAHQRWEIALDIIRDQFETIGWEPEVARAVASTTTLGMWQAMKHGYRLGQEAQGDS